MIVFYSKPNVMSLPYEVIKLVELRDKENQLVYDKSGKVRMVEKKSAEYFKFIPGKNKISKELWLKIVDYNKEDWDYYSTILTIFRPIIDEETKAEVGEEDDKINIKTLNAREMRDLVENTMDINEINRYLKIEKERDKTRPSVMKAIKSRKAQITKADEAFSKDQKD